MMQKTTKCASTAVMLEEEISKCVDILQGVAQEYTLSPNVFSVYINGIIVVVEAAKKRVKAGEDKGSRLMLTDDFVGISETLVGLQKLIGKALHYEMGSDRERKKVRSRCM